MNEELKRFRMAGEIASRNSEFEPAMAVLRMVPDESGSWVKFDDASAELEQVKKQLEEAEDIILYCSNWIPKNENSEILKRIKQWLSHYRKQG